MALRKIAAYAATPNMYEQMETAAKSIVANSPVEKIYLLTEHDKFPKWLPDDLFEIVNVKDQEYFDEYGPNMNSGFTYMAMMRAAYSKIFPDIDEILSLDIDTFVVDDLSRIWRTNLDDYYLAAVEEPNATRVRGYKYYNIGVALYNLKKLREDGKDDEVIAELNAHEHRFLEQDVFSELCKGRIYTLHPDYNWCAFTGTPKRVRIRHFAGIKDWRSDPMYVRWKSITWDHILRERERKYGK